MTLVTDRMTLSFSNDASCINVIQCLNRHITTSIFWMMLHHTNVTFTPIVEFGQTIPCPQGPHTSYRCLVLSLLQPLKRLAGSSCALTVTLYISNKCMLFNVVYQFCLHDLWDFAMQHLSLPNQDPFTVFSTFEWEQLAKVCQHGMAKKRHKKLAKTLSLNMICWNITKIHLPKVT